ncbi:T6SS effector BTH_I2691 family protein [Achromobacter sp. UBA4530]|uniref:T6SS effector BTH_I2691 family protein n=1 Tax=Achromobacter sp. UBA4530 TaxID=1945912 RepID=UPI00257E88CE|nr:T6SS effector BTH_I2691 family protein [Achromobacter sp. UBA4530]
MNTSKTLTQARRQAAPNPTGTCAACERTGLPILPLRLAIMPVTDGLSQHGALSQKSIQTALRVLRQGYVYVLLDKEIWHAYQVTPEGYLRQFNPFSMPRAKPEPLATSCVDAGHDLRAAFINIDTATHKQAWIAFSQDPWPKATLDAYRTGKYVDGKALPADYRERFRVVNLLTLKQDPTGGNQALALENGDDLHQHVAEYAIGTHDFGSVHDWHPRHARLEAMQAQLRMLEKQHGLPKGVAGLVLPDPVGMAAELNSLRLSVNTMRQRWREEPTRRYAYLTSQCLLGIKAYIAQHIEAAHPPPPPPSDYWTSSESGVPPVYSDPAQDRARAVDSENKRRMARLEDRYWETGPAGRKTFQDSYDKEDENFQKQIDAYATDWADLVTGANWRRVMALDYADSDARSRQYRLSATAACLAGGITDAPPQQTTAAGESKPGEKPTPEVLGPSSQVWQDLLSDGGSPVYTALNGQHTDLQQAFEPQFTDAMPSEAGKKYFDAIKMVATSKEGSHWRGALVVEAADQLLAAIHDASNRLENTLSIGAKAALDNLQSGAAWLYGKAKFTQITIQLTVGECFELLSSEIREHANSAQKATGKRARAMLLGSLITIPNANVRNVLINVTLWAHGTAEEVKKRILDFSQEAKEGAQDIKQAAGALGQEVKREAQHALRQVNAGLKNLEPAATAVLNGMQVGAAGARRVASSTFSSLKSLAVGSVDGGLSFIGLYFLRDSLKSAIADLDGKVGAKHPEAVAAFYSVSLGFVGASVEAAGLAIKIPADAAKDFVLRWGAEKTPVLTRVVGLGSKMVMIGGAISALAGIADAGASFRAVVRVIKAGEAVVAIPYAFSGFLSIIGAGLTYFGVIGSLALFGPLGAGVIVGLVAYAMLQIARSLESDALEKWARRCYFGRTESSERWRDPDDMDVAIAALNAAVLGMDVDLRFSNEDRAISKDELYSEDVEVLKNRGAVKKTKALVYSATLPGFDAERSRYRFALTIERFDLARDGKRRPILSSHVMASGQVNDTARAIQTSTLDDSDYTLVGETKPTSERPVLSGWYWLDPINKIKSATFAVAFWPDKDDSTGFAAIEITEQL